MEFPTALQTDRVLDTPRVTQWLPGQSHAHGGEHRTTMMCPLTPWTPISLGRASKPSLAYAPGLGQGQGMSEVSGEQDQDVSPQGPSSATRAHVTLSIGVLQCWEGGRDGPKISFTSAALTTSKPNTPSPLLPVQPQLLPPTLPTHPPPKSITPTPVIDPKSLPHTLPPLPPPL